MKIGLPRQNTLMTWPSAIGAEIDLDRRAGGDGRGVRVHLRDQRHQRRGGADRADGAGRDVEEIAACRLGRNCCHGVQVPRSLPVSPPARDTARLHASNRGGGRAGRSRPWGRTKGGNPAAFIGTLAKQSASPLSRAMTKSRTNPLSIAMFRPLTQRQCAAETTAMRIALYEPDIPQNTGTILRLSACLGVEAHIIEPAGFPTSDRAFRRAGMDYLDQVALVRHASWAAFEAWRRTAGAAAHPVHHRRRRRPISTTPIGPDDILLFGRESAGVPEAVHRAADARLLRSRCGRACARSMWRWPPPWHWARRCGRRTAFRNETAT